MAKRLQLRKGNTADHSTFVGALAELTVNTQTGTVLLHDGSTPGGHALAMAASVETALGLKINTSEIGVSVQPYNSATVIAPGGVLPALDGSNLTNLPTGFADPMTNAGDMIYRNGSNATARLGVGTEGQVLKSVGGVPVWSTLVAGVTDHTQLSNIGTNTHAQIDTHIGDATKHRVINDAGTTTVDLWSASKISSELSGKEPSFSKNTAFNKNFGTVAGTVSEGNHVHSSYAPLASPALTGTPTAPTPTVGDNTTKIATTAFVQAAVSAGGGISLSGCTAGNYHVWDETRQFSVTATSYTKMYEIKVKMDGTIRVLYDYKSTVNLKWSYTKVYINGVAAGTQRATLSSTAATSTEDFTVAAGDLVQIYGYAESGNSAAVLNIKIGVADPFIIGKTT